MRYRRVPRKCGFVGHQSICILASVAAALLLSTGCGAGEFSELAEEAVKGSSAAVRERTVIATHQSSDGSSVTDILKDRAQNTFDDQGTLKLLTMGADGKAGSIQQETLDMQPTYDDENNNTNMWDQTKFDAEVDAALVALQPADVADLLGALEKAVLVASNIEGNGRKSAVLISTGALRTGELDLYHEVTSDEWAPMIASAAQDIGSTDVAVEIVLTSFAQGSDPDPAVDQRIGDFWGDVCDAIKDGHVNSCSLEAA